MAEIETWISQSAEETEAIGRSIGATLSTTAIFCLFGELGTGKTTLIKGIVSEFTGVQTREVQSPTFTYLNIYEGKRSALHFDLYRLKNARDFLSLGFDEYLECQTPCMIEWAEKIEEMLTRPYTRIDLGYLEGEKRIIQMRVPEGGTGGLNGNRIRDKEISTPLE